MRQQILKLKNSKKESFYTNDFYNMYLEEKNPKYYPHEIDLNQKKLSVTKKEILPKKIFIKIIKQYLIVFFQDLFFNDIDSYFFLTGRISLAVMPKRIRVVGPYMTINSFKDNIVLVWYQKPSKRFHFMVKIKKLMGSTSRIRLYEAKAVKNNMLDKLTNFKKLKKKLIELKQLYKCIQN